MLNKPLRVPAEKHIPYHRDFSSYKLSLTLGKKAPSRVGTGDGPNHWQLPKQGTQAYLVFSAEGL